MAESAQEVIASAIRPTVGADYLAAEVVASLAFAGYKIVPIREMPDEPRDLVADLRMDGVDGRSLTQVLRLSLLAADEIERLRLLLQRCLCTMDADYHAPLIKDINEAGIVHVCSAP